MNKKQREALLETVRQKKRTIFIEERLGSDEIKRKITQLQGELASMEKREREVDIMLAPLLEGVEDE